MCRVHGTSSERYAGNLCNLSTMLLPTIQGPERAMHRAVYMQFVIYPLVHTGVGQHGQFAKGPRSHMHRATTRSSTWSTTRTLPVLLNQYDSGRRILTCTQEQDMMARFLMTLNRPVCKLVDTSLREQPVTLRSTVCRSDNSIQWQSSFGSAVCISSYCTPC